MILDNSSVENTVEVITGSVVISSVIRVVSVVDPLLVVGDNIAVAAEYYSGAQGRLHALLLRQVRIVEKVSEQGVVKQWVLALLAALASIDVDHRRGCNIDGVGVGHRAAPVAVAWGQI